MNSSTFASPRMGARSRLLVGALALIAALMTASSAQATAVWKAPENLLQQADFSIYDTQIAVAPSGEAVSLAVRSNTTSSSSDIVYAVRQPGGPWGAAKQLTNTPADRYVDSPAIAVDGQGNYLAIWNEDNDVSNAVRIASKAPGAASFGATAPLSTTVTGGSAPRFRRSR